MGGGVTRFVSLANDVLTSNHRILHSYASDRMPRQLSQEQWLTKWLEHFK